MRILFVASFNKGYFAPFILEQKASLEREGCVVDMFPVTGKGVRGYLHSHREYIRHLKRNSYDIVHAHYGLSGLLACLQRRVPVVVTYHGSDINEPAVLKWSKTAMRLARYNIFVSQSNIDTAKPSGRFALLPCGVELNELQLTGRVDARRRLGLETKKKYILFAGAFDNEVKNPALAEEAVAMVDGAELLELKGYSREQVTLLMCAADCLLMTSHTEGSPQVIKEALVCGCPTVSVDAGDVKERTAGIEGCHIAGRDARDIADKLGLALSFAGKTEGRKRIIESGLTVDLVARRLIEIYREVLKQ